jgi:hypothetical protein
MNKKSKIVVNILVILIVLSIVLYFSLKDNFSQIISCICKMDYKWLLLGILFLVMYRSLVGLSSYFITKINGEKISLLRSIQINFIILFFHGVTPFAGGGQPMEVYYLHNEGIDVTKSTNIVLQNFIVYQIALILMGTFAVIINYNFHLFADDSLIKKLVILGFVINLLVLVIICLLSFCKRINQFLCNKVLNFLGKIHIIKDVSLAREKITVYLDNFYKNAKILKKNKLKVVCIILINLLAISSLYSIPFAVIYGMGAKDINILSSIATTAYVMIIGSFIPIPGATGGVEYGFMFFFKYLINGNILTASMLIWRLISYYFGMMIGAVCLMGYRKKESKCE